MDWISELAEPLEEQPGGASEGEEIQVAEPARNTATCYVCYEDVELSLCAELLCTCQDRICKTCWERWNETHMRGVTNGGCPLCRTGARQPSVVLDARLMWYSLWEQRQDLRDLSPRELDDWIRGFLAGFMPALAAMQQIDIRSRARPQLVRSDAGIGVQIPCHPNDWLFFTEERTVCRGWRSVHSGNRSSFRVDRRPILSTPPQNDVVQRPRNHSAVSGILEAVILTTTVSVWSLGASTGLVVVLEPSHAFVAQSSVASILPAVFMNENTARSVEQAGARFMAPFAELVSDLQECLFGYNSSQSGDADDGLA